MVPATRSKDNNMNANQSIPPASSDSHRSSSSDSGNTLPAVDSQIDQKAALAYWSSTPATIDDMLGGYPQVSRVDLQSSKSFIRKVQRLNKHSSSSKLPRILEGGAGLGRVTSGLLVHVATQVDIVEPVAKFVQVIIDSDLKRDGQVGEVWIQGLETFTPPQSKKYDIVWNQWCLGHLTDRQVVEWLERAKQCLRGYDEEGRELEKKDEDDGDVSEQKGWIFVKENLSTDIFGKDVFDKLDSAVTRTDNKFRHIFEEAGLRIVKMEITKGFSKGILPVKMYALRPK